MCSIVRGKFAKVYKSLSQCIFQNLAFEEYLFRNHNVSKHGEVLLIWSNHPAVVVGRHQNTWIEANLEYLKKNEIEIARRHSGGGTVYHDLGNINISLLTTHEQHCRPKNLKFISDSLNDSFNINIVPNKRDDMELQPGSRKCSGTAARIARGQAYHHLTLLIDADLDILSSALRSPHRDRIKTNATRSVRAPAVGYLRQDNKNITVKAAENAIINAYRSQFSETLFQEVDIHQEISNNDEIREIYDDLKSWKWIYGKSPKFTYHNSENIEIQVKDGFVIDDSTKFSI